MEDWNGRPPGAAGPSSRQYSYWDGQRAPSLGFKQRIKHFTWTWFAMTMATGGLANMIHSIPLRFPGLYEIGCFFFLFNIVLFAFNIAMISTRFYLYPVTFRASFIHPTESLFAPAAIISFGTILINITQYGTRSTVDRGHGLQVDTWLTEAMMVLFWIYCALAIIFSCGIYLVMWSTQTFTISRMTPTWIFPAYPLLLAGPYAGNLAGKLPNHRALQVIIGGYVLQATGFMVAFMIYASFIYRLMTEKLPRESVRPGMFISVGPSGFTINGIMNMGNLLPAILESHEEFMGIDGKLAGAISMVIANWTGIWMWGLALWFFLISIGAHYSSAAKGHMEFAMTWYSFVFPNTALVSATFTVAKVLGPSRPIQIFGCVLACMVLLTWAFVFCMTIRAVITRQVLWPQMQEDRDEGGFARGRVEEETMTAVRAAAALEGRPGTLSSNGNSDIRDGVRRRRAGTLERMLRDKEEEEVVGRMSTDRAPRSRVDEEANAIVRAYSNLSSV
ncbi:hypothetical protein P152DRAFT_391685 [Eremomyces bilateralis CBS 781.70]|uniref:C4-dicarboxylate/malic acid transporter n=1 Tax=Eremomyces bilateralis CBS 781.70 TaxID=1392243 RepID=A0A6G1GAE6_9PEZI|nr:uncharacterized protein P152DRAFT_391685 [Eremomyces bilateralis CBS 781.70]KAF1814809.1 hypothetical protein P152DRAFT_391685 [Eremomyces bilateralis CBS 781.70]